MKIQKGDTHLVSEYSRNWQMLLSGGSLMKKTTKLPWINLKIQISCIISAMFGNVVSLTKLYIFVMHSYVVDLVHEYMLYITNFSLWFTTKSTNAYIVNDVVLGQSCLSGNKVPGMNKFNDRPTTKYKFLRTTWNDYLHYMRSFGAFWDTFNS